MEKKTCSVCGQELPIESFTRNGLGYTSVCSECANKKKRESWQKRKERKTLEKELANAKALRLEDFTPRELMQELKRRGYEFEMTYTEVHKISSKAL